MQAFRRWPQGAEVKHSKIKTGKKEEKIEGCIIPIVGMNSRSWNTQESREKCIDHLLRCLLKELQTEGLIFCFYPQWWAVVPRSVTSFCCELCMNVGWESSPSIYGIKVISGQKAMCPPEGVTDHEVSWGPPRILPNMWLNSEERLRESEAGRQ